jgi:cold shock CspA family protein
MRSRSILDYAAHVGRVANGESVDDDVDELLVLLGRSWTQYVDDCDAIREVLHKRALLGELRALRLAVERLANGLAANEARNSNSQPLGICTPERGGNDMHEIVEYGTVVSLVLERGFGFIKRRAGADLFFHATALQGGLEFDEALVERPVTFEVRNVNGRPRAVDVRPA